MCTYKTCYSGNIYSSLDFMLVTEIHHVYIKHVGKSNVWKKISRWRLSIQTPEFDTTVSLVIGFEKALISINCLDTKQGVFIIFTLFSNSLLSVFNLKSIVCFWFHQPLVNSSQYRTNSINITLLSEWTHVHFYSDNKTLIIDFQGATVFKNEIGRRLRHRTPTSSTCWTTGIFRETADQT